MSEAYDLFETGGKDLLWFLFLLKLMILLQFTSAKLLLCLSAALVEVFKE